MDPRYAVWLLATLNARSSFNKDLPSFIDMSRLPTAAGEMRFKHPMVEGTEIVISITSNGATSDGGSLYVGSMSIGPSACRCSASVVAGSSQQSDS